MAARETITLSGGTTLVIRTSLNTLDLWALEECANERARMLETFKRLVVSPKLIIDDSPPAEPDPSAPHIYDLTTEDITLLLQKAKQALGGASPERFRRRGRRKAPPPGRNGAPVRSAAE